MNTPWEPANDIEVALRDAARDSDTLRYRTVLAEAVVLVPVQAPTGEDDRDGVQAPALVHTELPDGSVVIPAFTSPEALRHPDARVIAEQQASVPVAELTAAWPDPAWLLAVNPGLPIAGHLSGAELPALMASVFEPVNDAERVLAAPTGWDDVVAALATCDLHLPVPATAGGGDLPDLTAPAFPWWCGTTGAPVPDGTPTVVPVFTSPERLRGRLGTVRRPRSVVVDLLALAAAWPDPRWILTVNPGAPFVVSFLPEQLRVLAERLPDLLAAEVDLQVPIPHELVASYLDQGYGKAAGVVHLRPSGPVPVRDLYAELGLLRPGSPFSVGDESVHVIRWRPEREVGARWVREPAPRTETVQLPHGAQLVELRGDGDERLVATYHPDRHCWTSTAAG